MRTGTRADGRIRRQSERLRRRLRGDLDRIAAKALEKDPRRRYASVDELSADIQRHLSGLPVKARPATLGLRAAKLLRRHPIAISAGALAVALILAFAGAAWYQARQSERRFLEVRGLAHSVMFDLHDAIAPLPGSTKARALLVREALDYLERLSRESSGDPRLAREIALGYERIATVEGAAGEANLGNAKVALDSYRKSAEILEKISRASPSNRQLVRDYLRVSNELAAAYGGTGDSQSAALLARKNIALAEEQLRARPSDPAAISDLAIIESEFADQLTTQSRFTDAIPVRQRVLEIFEQPAGANNPERQRSLALAHKKLAALYAKVGSLTGSIAGARENFDEGRREYQAARAIDEARCAGDPSNLAARMDLSYDYSDLGWICSHLNQEADALGWHQKALAIRTQAVKADPNDQRAAIAVASSTGRIAGVYSGMGDFERAIATARRAIPMWKTLSAKPGASWSIAVELADGHGAARQLLRRFREETDRCAARAIPGAGGVGI